MSPTFVAYMFTLKCNILFWVVGYRWWPIGGTWFLWNYNHHRFYRSRTDLAIDRNGPYFITLLLFQKLFGNLLGWQAKKLLFVCLGCCTFRIKRDCKRISTESIFLHFFGRFFMKQSLHCGQCLWVLSIWCKICANFLQLGVKLHFIGVIRYHKSPTKADLAYEQHP